MRTGKQYTQEQAAAFASLAYQADTANAASNTSNFFIGHISSDRSTATDIQTNILYTLSYSGNPKEFDLCQKTSTTTAICIGSQITSYVIDGTIGVGIVVAQDNTGFYLRNTGSDTPYYLPTTSEFQTIFGQAATPTNAQIGISSDGNALVVGTVLQNVHTIVGGATAIFDASVSLFHQYALYYVVSELHFGTLTDLINNTAGYLPSLSYPGGVTNVVWCKHLLEELIDLNTYANGNVPAPTSRLPNTPGDADSAGNQALWFPNSTSQSSFFQFNPLLEFTWHGDSGYQSNFYQNFGTCTVDFSGQKTSNGLQTYTWDASPNYAVFTNFRFNINNTAVIAGSQQPTVYNVDLISTFVNGYLFSVSNVQWTEDFFFQYDAVLEASAFCSCGGEAYGSFWHFFENLNFDYQYEYDTDFIYKLEYFPTPDVWLTTATVNTTTSNPAWQKFFSGDDYQNPAGPSYCGAGYNFPNPSDGSYWDAYCSETPSISNTKSPPGNCYTGGFQAGGGSSFAYSSTQTIGCPFSSASGCLPLYQNEGFAGGAGRAEFDYYDGLQKVGPFDVQGGGSWPGFYLAYYTGPAEYNYVDLNYDQLFGGTSPTYYSIFGGRSSMVLTGLNTTTPTIYGIVSQMLGDGTDSNILASAFRGRSGTLSDTAFVYKQSFNGIWRYSASWLQAGNLDNIRANPSSNPPLSPTNDPYTQAIIQLVDWQSLADAYGDDTTSTLIGNLMARYKAAADNPVLIPTAADIQTVITAIGNMDPDLIPSAAELQDQLLSFNAAIAGGTEFQIQPDMIGTAVPDVYTDAIFSFSATFPFQPFALDSQKQVVTFDRFLKAIDSWLVQEYYIDTVNNLEVITGFNIADGTNPDAPAGLTTVGSTVSKTYKPVLGEQLLDFVMPITPTAVVT